MLFTQKQDQHILRGCAVAHNIRLMTTAYDSGSVPEIEVRHRLRIAREHAGLEQDELADLIGVSRNTIGNAEKGRVKARKITLNAWALACGVPVSWIEHGEVSSTRPPDDGGPGTSKPVGYLPPARIPAPIIQLQPTG